MTGTSPAGGAPSGRPQDGPLRVAMITTFYPPYSFGGDAIAIERLAKALVRRECRVTVIHDVDAYNLLHRGPEPEPSTGQPDGLEVVSLKSGLGPISPILTQQLGRPVASGSRIRQVLTDGSFHVVHFNNVSLVGGPGVLSAGEGIKVFEAHEHWLVCPSHVLWKFNREPCTGRACVRCVLSYKRPPQLWRQTGYLERQLSEVDVFIAKSEFSRRKHAEFGFDRDMHVLPYFLPDVPDDSPAARPEDAPHDRPYFLFVGRLERIKGLEDVIPAFESYADADLLVAGDGTHEAELRKLASGCDRVRFLGRTSPKALERYYRHAIALVVPSVCFETFGIILIEAFRQRTPVIARRIGPFPEIVEACGGGELFRTREELVASMRRLQHEPSYREGLARRALRGFRERWSESAVVPRYLDLVGQAAERSGRSEIARAVTSAA
jgi:glycosyltransferase involved in cell wall biosynthesis